MPAYLTVKFINPDTWNIENIYGNCIKIKDFVKVAFKSFCFFYFANFLKVK